MEISGPPGMGWVRNADERTLSCGTRTPKLRRNKLVQAPAATITVLHLTLPRSVTTPLTRPACVSIVRTAVLVKSWAPSPLAARAIAGAASVGSARPSEGVNSPPFQLVVHPGMC